MTELYDPDHLRTFLTVAQTRSFTQAATRLGVRQPTVSSHISKLEQATGRQLLARDTHSVSLTPDGEAMIGFARGILASYAPAHRYFAGPQPSGRVRLGLSDDLALTRLPEILRTFRREHPLIDLELTVDQSGQLHRRLERNQLDLFLGKQPLERPEGTLVKRDRLVWIGTLGTALDRARPLPLVIYPAPSISRAQMLAALDRDGTAYRTTCLCRGFNGLVAAVSAGIGISAVAAGMVPPSVAVLGPEYRLPKLGHIDVVLIPNPRTSDRTPVQALTETILGSGAHALSRDAHEPPVPGPSPIPAPPRRRRPG
jgi:DNA-binding transcriptional LysR family regulator